MKSQAAFARSSVASNAADDRRLGEGRQLCGILRKTKLSAKEQARGAEHVFAQDLLILRELQLLVAVKLPRIPLQHFVRRQELGLKGARGLEEERKIQRRPRPGMSAQAALVDLDERNWRRRFLALAVHREEIGKTFLQRIGWCLTGLAHQEQADEQHENHELSATAEHWAQLEGIRAGGKAERTLRDFVRGEW